MRSLKKVIDIKEPESDWIRIQNKRFKKSDVDVYYMHSQSDNLTLIIFLKGGRELTIEFRESETEEYKYARTIMKSLDDYFKIKDLNQTNHTYF